MRVWLLDIFARRFEDMMTDQRITLEVFTDYV
jgi:hypothetical protein